MVGDTHIPLQAPSMPRALSAAVAAADYVLHTGDFGSLSAYEEFARLARHLRAVRGNHDVHDLDRVLPERDEFELAGRRVVLVHGHRWGRPRPSRMGREFRRVAEVVVYGHLHRPFVGHFGPTLVVNPGTPLPSGGPVPGSWVEAEFGPAGVKARVVALSE
jgi:putative phosphoesterase